MMCPLQQITKPSSLSIEGRTFSMSKRKGFTAVEVILVIALLAAFLGLAIVYFFSLENPFERRPALERLNQAIARAHWHAQTRNETVSVSFDAESESLLIHSARSDLLERFRFVPGSQVEMTFYPVLPDDRIDSEPSFEPWEYALDRIRIAPWGAVPFIVEWETRTTASEFVFDPFSVLKWRTQSEL